MITHLSSNKVWIPFLTWLYVIGSVFVSLLTNIPEKIGNKVFFGWICNWIPSNMQASVFLLTPWKCFHWAIILGCWIAMWIMGKQNARVSLDFLVFSGSCLNVGFHFQRSRPSRQWACFVPGSSALRIKRAQVFTGRRSGQGQPDVCRKTKPWIVLYRALGFSLAGLRFHSHGQSMICFLLDKLLPLLSVEPLPP